MSAKEIPDELIDQLLAGREGPEAITGPDGLLERLTKRVVERAMSAELTDHLGYELGEQPREGSAESPQRVDVEDVDHRSRSGPGRGAS